MDGEDKVELSRQRMREHTLNQFKHVRTCILARELCLLCAPTEWHSMQKTPVSNVHLSPNYATRRVAKSKVTYAAKPLKRFLTSEEKYLELCEQSCMKCGESRRTPPRPTPERTAYVA